MGGGSGKRFLRSAGNPQRITVIGWEEDAFDRETELLDGGAGVARDVRTGNAQVVQLTVGQVGQFVVGPAVAFPVVEFAYNVIDHGSGLLYLVAMTPRIGDWPVHLVTAGR